MSRGLGKLQRAILAEFETPGPPSNWEHAELPDDCRDRRTLCKKLARHMGGMDRETWISIAWSASFSRAVRTLFERGELERPGLVRLPNPPPWDPEDRYGARRLHFLSDGVFLDSPKWLLRRTFKTSAGLVDPDEVLSTAIEVARQVSALPPMAIRSGKRVLQQNMSKNFHDALRNETLGLQFATRSPHDAAEQRSAFLEKRKPTFTGN